MRGLSSSAPKVITNVVVFGYIAGTKPSILVVTIALLAPALLQGQRLAPVSPYAVSAGASPTASYQLDSTKTIPRTYWLEGGLIGGVVMGVFTIGLAGLGEGHTSTAGHAMAFLIGASVGFPVGSLIGGQFPKH